MWTLICNPWAWLACLALIGGSYVTGRWHQYRSDIRATAEAKFAESETTRLRERAAHLNAQRIADAKDAKNRARVARLADELERVRNRPDRLPEAADTACAGATGRALSGPDAAFLVRLADDADRIRNALDACQQREAVSHGPTDPR